MDDEDNEEDYESFHSNAEPIEGNINGGEKEKKEASKEEIDNANDDIYKFDDVSIEEEKPDVLIFEQPDNIHPPQRKKNQNDEDNTENNKEKVINEDELFKPIDKVDLDIETKENKQSDNTKPNIINKEEEDKVLNGNNQQLEVNDNTDNASEKKKEKEQNAILSQLYVTETYSKKLNNKKKKLNISDQPDHTIEQSYTECNTNNNKYSNMQIYSNSYARAKEEYKLYAKESYEFKINANSNRPFSIDHSNTPQVPLSKFEKAEIKYGKLKQEILNVINISNKNSTDISNQNTKMISFLSSLNTIVGDLTENVRFPIIKVNNKNNAQQQSKEIISAKDKELLERYKKEYLSAQARFNQISDSAYEYKINQELTEVKTRISYYENDNKTLKNAQKISGVLLAKHYRFLPKIETEIKRIEMEHNALKNQYDTVLVKLEKDKKVIKENEAKIKELAAWKNKLEQTAKETYGITKFVNVEEREGKRRRNQEKIERLIKNNKILDNAIEVNKKKYDNNLKEKEKEIDEKEKKKGYFLNSLKDKTHQIEHFNEMVNALYSLSKNNYNNSNKEDNTNNEVINDLIKPELSEDKVDNNNNNNNELIISKYSDKDSIELNNNDNNGKPSQPLLVSNVNSFNIVNESCDNLHLNNTNSNNVLSKENFDYQYNALVKPNKNIESKTDLVLPLIENPHEKKVFDTNNSKQIIQSNSDNLTFEALQHRNTLTKESNKDSNVLNNQFTLGEKNVIEEKRNNDGYIRIRTYEEKDSLPQGNQINNDRNLVFSNKNNEEHVNSKKLEIKKKEKELEIKRTKNKNSIEDDNGFLYELK